MLPGNFESSLKKIVVLGFSLDEFYHQKNELFTEATFTFLTVLQSSVKIFLLLHSLLETERVNLVIFLLAAYARSIFDSICTTFDVQITKICRNVTLLKI